MAGSMTKQRRTTFLILAGVSAICAVAIIGGLLTIKPPDPGESFQDSKPVLEFLDDGRASLRIYGTTSSDYVERCLDLGGEPDRKVVFGGKFYITKYLCYVEPDTIVGSEDECIQRGGKYSVVYVTNGPVQICQ